MASHAGLVYTIKTKKGYIKENNQYTENIEEAQKIKFERFGWTDASNVLKKLGYSNEEAKYVILVPSYDTRIGIIEDYLTLLGYNYPNYMYKAEEIYNQTKSYEYDNFLNCKKYLKREVENFYKNKETVDTLIIDEKTVELKEIENGLNINNLEYQINELYFNENKIYKYKYRLKNIPIEKYFDLNEAEKNYFKDYYNKIEKYILDSIVDKSILNSKYADNELTFYSYSSNLNNMILKNIRDFYENNQIHITRMFGSYILIVGNKTEMKAIKATAIPIKYCPLMIKLLKEVGGEYATELLKTLDVENNELQEQMMCKLINEVVIKGGYFDTNRALNSCESNVLFGASETISSAFENGLLDAAVIVSNNLGTIITTNSSNTQGAVKRMTGLFYTSPSEKLMKTAVDSKIIPVFPYTAEINQLEGVKKAMELGYKKIAVSVAASDNYLHEELKKLEEENDIIIYKFGLCSTGIDEKTALIMRDYADVIWSCASLQVKKHIEPYSIAQVGVKIPVHIMTKQGWEIIKNHLLKMNNKIDYENVELTCTEDKSVFINGNSGIVKLIKKNMKKCSDCPHPCI